MKKFITIAASAAFLFMGTMSAQAATLAELQAQITALLAAQMNGSSSMLSAHAGVNLTVGSEGPRVMELQSCMNAAGFPTGKTDGDYGPLTAAGVMAFQAQNGLKEDGIVGIATTPVFQAACPAVSSTPVTGTLPAGCTVSTGYSTTTGEKCDVTVTLPVGCTASTGYSTTTGEKCDATVEPEPSSLEGQGTINSVTLGSSDESDVNEGDTDVEVYAVDVELDDNGDLMIESVEAWFAETTLLAESSKPWDYFKTVTLMVDGKEVASMVADSSSDWSSVVTDDNTAIGNVAVLNTGREYRLRFTGLDFIAKSDATTKVSIAVSTLNNIDSADNGAIWNVDLGDMRVVDGTGFTTNENYSVTDLFTINSSSEKSDITVRVAGDSPEAMVIEVDTTNDTDGEDIYNFEIEEDNNVNVNIEEITATFVTTGAENVIIKRAYLYQGNTKVGDESMTAAGVVVFDNMDINIDANTTESFSVKVDLEDTNNGVRYAEGSVISVTIDSLDLFTDANENDENDINPSISGASEIHELRTEGIMVTLIDVTKTISSAGDPATPGSTDKGTYTVVFEATAFGADQRIDKSSANGLSTAVVNGQGVLFSTNADTTVTSSLVSGSTDSEDNSFVFELDEGIAREFTLTAVATSTNDLAEVVLETINYGALLTDANASFYTFNLDEFKTGEQFLNTY